MSMMTRLLVALRAPFCCGFMAAVVWASAVASAREPTKVPPDDEPTVSQASATAAEPPEFEEAESEETAEAPEGEDAAETDVYFLAIFSSQSVPKVPARTHNWGI